MTDTSTEHAKATHTGPLKFPTPRYVTTRKALMTQLRGHTTAANWLPENLSHELNDLRAEMLRLRDRVQVDLDAQHKLDRKFQLEDTEHNAALKEAYRAGLQPPEDRRTPEEQREAARDVLAERVEAGIEVLAEVAERTVDTIREQEPDLLGALRAELTGAEEKRREAERLVAEARAEEWRIHRLGQWVMGTADDGPFGRQPAPRLEPLPAQVSPELLRTSLERPWWKTIPRTMSTRAAA